MSILLEDFVQKIAGEGAISSRCLMLRRNFLKVAMDFEIARCSNLALNFRLLGTMVEARDLKFFGKGQLETDSGTVGDSSVQLSLVPVEPGLDDGARNQVFPTTNVG
ncbi:hypothetical protein [Sphingorhabdus sp. YGSMI21]|jgi:hypothetical protein|uniref:hypothetical protein n=1 Tax=Sphingorhabdus sp. YGSMI21 TaxID=2077182 RepID=UPI000C1F1B30|nr:hypothetical protein [Sphingorhabdus sp. YGSMI21]ATW05745.1 hypothetical protein CHN51_18910 [Sphingorhabdus sp. YGSMI21]